MRGKYHTVVINEKAILGQTEVGQKLAKLTKMGQINEGGVFSGFYHVLISKNTKLGAKIKNWGTFGKFWGKLT